MNRNIRPGADPKTDPRGLIYEAYRIPEISAKDCRTILLDWTLGMPDQVDCQRALQELHATYGRDYPDHPMTRLISEGLSRPEGGKPVRGRHSSRRRGNAPPTDRDGN